MQAVQEVGGLNEADFYEIRSYNTPPEPVKLVLMAVCLMFNQSTDWRSAQRLLADQVRICTHARSGGGLGGSALRGLGERRKPLRAEGLTGTEARGLPL